MQLLDLYLKFLSTFFFQIAGLFLIGIGIWLTVEEQRYGGSRIPSDWMFVDISIGIILLGIIVFLIPVIGFLGAIRENVVLLKIVSGL